MTDLHAIAEDLRRTAAALRGEEYIPDEFERLRYLDLDDPASVERVRRALFVAGKNIGPDDEAPPLIADGEKHEMPEEWFVLPSEFAAAIVAAMRNDVQPDA